MRYLLDEHPQRFMLLKMQGTLMGEMHKIDNAATSMLTLIMEQMLENDPMPKTDDIMIRVKHLNTIKAKAEEIVIPEVIYKIV